MQELNTAANIMTLVMLCIGGIYAGKVLYRRCDKFSLHSFCDEVTSDSFNLIMLGVFVECWSWFFHRLYWTFYNYAKVVDNKGFSYWFLSHDFWVIPMFIGIWIGIALWCNIF